VPRDFCQSSGGTVLGTRQVWKEGCCGKKILKLGELISNLAPLLITIKRFLRTGLNSVRNWELWWPPADNRLGL